MRRWEDLRPELDAHGVRLVTVCADTPAEIAKGRVKHGSKATMLSDADLAVTDAYNLRNPINLSPKSAMPKPLPIPTTILVDASGTVRWIDQGKDYQERSHPDLVLGAIREHLGG